MVPKAKPSDFKNFTPEPKGALATKTLSDKDFEIIASGTIFIEPKIIRGGRCVGHIEDIVVDNKVRGKRIGVDLIKELVKIAKEKRCYRVTLFCDESLVNFYDKNGFGVSGTAMKVHLVN